MRGIGVGVVALMVLAACSQGGAPSDASSAATAVTRGAAAFGTLDPRFNATASAGGAVVTSGDVGDLTAVFASVDQASQLNFSASATPNGATGADVQLVSVVAQDTGGVLKGMDAAAKRTFGDALLTAASKAWPNASISLLISDPAGASGTIIGSRPQGGQNTVFAS
jgi:hypothetical protein